MANTVIQPVALTTFISQVNHIMQRAQTGANGEVTDQPRGPDRWDEMVNRIVSLGKLKKTGTGWEPKRPRPCSSTVPWNCRSRSANMVSGLLLGVGFIMVAFTERKRGLHDIIAGTCVIKDSIVERWRHTAQSTLTK